MHADRVGLGREALKEEAQERRKEAEVRVESLEAQFRTHQRQRHEAQRLLHDIVQSRKLCESLDRAAVRESRPCARTTTHAQATAHDRPRMTDRA